MEQSWVLWDPCDHFTPYALPTSPRAVVMRKAVRHLHTHTRNLHARYALPTPPTTATHRDPSSIPQPPPTTTRARTDKVLTTPVCRPLFPFRLYRVPWIAMATASLEPPRGGGSGGCARGLNTSGRPSRWPWQKRCTTRLHSVRRLPRPECGQESLTLSRGGRRSTCSTPPYGERSLRHPRWRRRKLVELEVKRKEAELQSLAAATKAMVQQRAIGSSSWTSALARSNQLRRELKELRERRGRSARSDFLALLVLAWCLGAA